MSQLNPLKNQSDPDRIYYDIQITNLQSASTPPPTLYFNEIRNTPFVQCPEDYYFSIIRFTLDTPTLPVFVPEIDTSPITNPYQLDPSGNPIPNTQDVNQTIYSYQFSYAGYFDPSGQTFVEWSAQDATALQPTGFSRPNSNNALQINNTGYYNCYSYEWFIELLNTQFTTTFATFKSKYEAFQILNPSYPLFPAGAVAPQWAWDSSSLCARVIFTSDFQNGGITAPANPIFCYFNAPLYNLFSSLNAKLLRYSNTGRNWVIQVVPQAQFNTYTLVGVTYISVVQQWSTTPQLSPVSSVVFVSNTLPIVSNQLSAPLLYNEGNILSNYGNNSNFQQIITDLVAGDGVYKPNLVYNPTAQYRLIDLRGNYPLSSIDISVFWKDRTGQLIPFLLGSGATATIKVLFTKKGTNTMK